VSHPIHSAPLRRAATSGQRRLWRCLAGERTSRRLHPGGGESRGEIRRVLVVDDEQSIRLLCRVNLGASGMEVLEAHDGKAGLELARSERPDLILLDVMMPGLDGWDVARELAGDASTREIPIVFLTARAETADRRRGAQLGGVGYVVKPFDPVGIGEVVENVIVRIGRGERAELQRSLADDTEL
jgi:DNA-binding response OmpR family regulator